MADITPIVIIRPIKLKFNPFQKRRLVCNNVSRISSEKGKWESCTKRGQIIRSGIVEQDRGYSIAKALVIKRVFRLYEFIYYRVFA